MSRRICSAARPSDDGLPVWCDTCRPGECVITEFRELGQPGGRERAMEAYREECRDRSAQRERGMDPQNLSYRLQKIGVPAEDIMALRGKLEDSAAVTGARRFLEAPTEAAMRYLLLLGGVGVGKTLAAAYVIRDEARRFDWNGQASGSAPWEPIQFVPAGDLTRLGSFGEDDRRRVDAMTKCRLLVVDDMGDEAFAPGRGALVDVLMKRDAGARRTVMTTNLTSERFAELYGAPLVSRIAARGIAPNLTKERSRRRRAA